MACLVWMPMVHQVTAVWAAMEVWAVQAEPEDMEVWAVICVPVAVADARNEAAEQQEVMVAAAGAVRRKAVQAQVRPKIAQIQITRPYQNAPTQTPQPPTVVLQWPIRALITTTPTRATQTI